MTHYPANLEKYKKNKIAKYFIPITKPEEEDYYEA
jgi:hypothetical protein